jgi:hypothetical protein
MTSETLARAPGLIGACLWVLMILVLPSAQAEESGLKSGAREAGRATGSAVREVGQGARKAGKEIGHGARKAGKTVGGAAREGGREFRRAVKGER